MPGRTINKSKDEKIVKVEVQEEQVQEEQSQEEQELEEEKTKKLFALYPILFESHQYKIGEQLPTHNMEMVEAWIEAEAAIWK
ncbi:hypothetical protein SAMN02746066_03403 [Anaerosporobacter mobilis DSM 15930]|jgi:hypothetical protein|uniref:Uncharacterized protein n=1 Tax=Anaerosporobacter mobilis DSM 15930 TaxID=1120996 RepID=A0A1M7LUF8_9FIRM|nr:hypothetical protein [Anaerosporobacter mobilis]SHM81733.1 hypothetical protein SAMN02746066_03403 [Anaerosporobacter mobilis DSM 15930]